VFLGAFVVALYPSIKQLPMATLAAVLMLTARRLIEVHEVKKILHIDRIEGALVLLTTVLTVVIDLTVSVPIGVGIMMVLAVRRMVQDRRVDVIEDDTHAVLTVRACVNFLTCSLMKHDLEAHLADPRIHVLDLVHVPYIDATGAVMMSELVASHPELAVWVTDEVSARKLVAAGVPAERVKQRGNRLVDLPKVFNAVGAPGPTA
jgi:SulP family sulfate permease